MDQQTLIMIVSIVLAAVAGFIGGNGAVYAFNKMPVSWLTDYGSEPPEELLKNDRQRLPSTPWKLVLSGIMIICSIRYASLDPLFAVSATAMTWLLIEISIADWKYSIIPDQLALLTAVCSLGFFRFHGSWKDILWGGGIGLGVMLIIALIGGLIYGREALGFGDVKLMCGIGLALGRTGIICTIIGMSFSSCIFFLIGIILKKIDRKDSKPLAPFIALSAIIYMMFLWKV